MRIKLNGVCVGSDIQWLYDWFGWEAFSPAVIRQAVQENPAGEDLELEINSGGGSVFAGFEIYSILREAPCKTVAIVQSLAASAASTAASGCKRVIMSPVSQMMIHLPTTDTYGNQRDHRQSLQLLDSITEGILNGYQLRCGEKTTRAKLKHYMEDETWIPAQDAVAMGLADEIETYGEESAAGLPLSVVNACGAGIRAIANSAGAPSYEDLLARYEREVRAGIRKAAPDHPVEGAPEDPAPEQRGNWRNSARLSIARAKTPIIF